MTKSSSNVKPGTIGEVIMAAATALAAKAFARPDVLTVDEWSALLAEAASMPDLRAGLKDAQTVNVSRWKCRAIAAEAYARGEFWVIVKAGSSDGEVAALGRFLMQKIDIPGL